MYCQNANPRSNKSLQLHQLRTEMYIQSCIVKKQQVSFNYCSGYFKEKVACFNQANACMHAYMHE